MRVGLLLVLMLLPLTACTRSVTYAERMQTAVVANCWPGNPTPPRPVTVTPVGYPTVLPVTPDLGTPTATRLPTTTALPRCTPGPGETLAAWPTPIPPPPAHPTLEGRPWQGGSGRETVLQLPNAALVLDLAVHPTDHWPVVAAIDVPITNRGVPRVYARVWHPQRHAWGVAQTIDTEASHPGQHVRSVAVGITGDNTIYAAWSASEYPELGLWVATSSDFGSIWSAPKQLGTGYSDVLDVSTTVDGQVAVLALTRSEPPRPMLLIRQADGSWAPRELPVPVWVGSAGSLALVADTAVVLLSGPNDGGGMVYLLRQQLYNPAYSLVSRAIPGEGERLATRARGMVFSQGRNRPPGLAFVVGERDQSSWYALVSHDGGQTWGGLEPIVAKGLSDGAQPVAQPFGGVGYDVQADRLLSIWTCCTDATWGNVAATHYGSWRDGAGQWHPAPDTPLATRVPVITGAKSAGLTVLAQALNTRFAWLAYIEDGQQVIVQSVDLNRLLPPDQYPTATPYVSPGPSPTSGGTP